MASKATTGDGSRLSPPNLVPEFCSVRLLRTWSSMLMGFVRGSPFPLCFLCLPLTRCTISWIRLQPKESFILLVGVTRAFMLPFTPMMWLFYVPLPRKKSNSSPPRLPISERLPALSQIAERALLHLSGAITSILMTSFSPSRHATHPFPYVTLAYPSRLKSTEGPLATLRT